tara:strand:- start:4048 stop:4863 length:816 start_codon:yes stop_codon:yes gene_type:complete
MDAITLIKKEGFRRKLSPITIKTYCFYVKKFLNFCGKEPRKISKKDIKDYLDSISETKTGNTLNVALNSIRFLSEEILFRNWRLKIKYSKRPKDLPVVLTKSEIKLLTEVITNPKHKLMISIMYSAGLRVSELVSLKTEDFDFEDNIGWVRHGKGNKDRLFIVAESLKQDIISWIDENGIESYLFMGYKNTPLSTKSVYNIVKEATKKAGIRKNVHPHTLRHSFATHIIENGYGLTSVQSLLGHSSMQTSLGYIHMVSPKMIAVKSPYDSL